MSEASPREDNSTSLCPVDHVLGEQANPFATVKGVRQLPFEIAAEIADAN